MFSIRFTLFGFGCAGGGVFVALGVNASAKRLQFIPPSASDARFKTAKASWAEEMPQQWTAAPDATTNLTIASLLNMLSPSAWRYRVAGSRSRATFAASLSG